MAKLYDEFKDDGFTVLAIDIKEPKARVTNYIKKEGLPFPVLLDNDGRVARKYGIRAHPDHFLINKNGEIVARVPGARNWTSKEIRDLIRSLVDQKL